MNLKRFLMATLGVGVAVNVLDFLVQGMWFTQQFYAKQPDLFRQEPNVTWLVVGDFVAAAVLVWVYARVYDCFGGGWKNGAKFGFYAGVLIGFPAYIFLHLMLNGYPYALAWASIVFAILWCMLGGAVAGLIYRKEG